MEIFFCIASESYEEYVRQYTDLLADGAGWWWRRLRRRRTQAEKKPSKFIQTCLEKRHIMMSVYC